MTRGWHLPMQRKNAQCSKNTVAFLYTIVRHKIASRTSCVSVSWSVKHEKLMTTRASNHRPADSLCPWRSGHGPGGGGDAWSLWRLASVAARRRHQRRRPGSGGDPLHARPAASRPARGGRARRHTPPHLRWAAQRRRRRPRPLATRAAGTVTSYKHNSPSLEPACSNVPWPLGEGIFYIYEHGQDSFFEMENNVFAP